MLLKGNAKKTYYRKFFIIGLEEIFSDNPDKRFLTDLI